MDDAVPEDIRFRARQWTIDLHAPGAGESLRRACERWRNADPRHEKAFQDAQRVWTLFARLPQQAAAPPRARDLRRSSVSRAARLAAAVALCAVVSA